MMAEDIEFANHLLERDWGIIFLDWNIKGMGPDWVKEKQSYGVWRRQYLIIHEKPENGNRHELAIQLGARDYFHKPITPQKMVEILNRARLNPWLNRPMEINLKFI